MNDKITSKKIELEKNVSKIAGFACELTVRGDRDFTVSADGKVEWSRLLGWFGIAAKNARSHYDAECDFSCLYFSV